MSAIKASFDHRKICGYHAHIYYADAEQRDIAAGIREALDARGDVNLGRWMDKPVGPHGSAMYQVAFDVDLLPELLPWLMSVRNGLSILVHCCTNEDNLRDHTAGALWLGEPKTLNLAFFGG